jgi:hypothetical protein
MPTPVPYNTPVSPPYASAGLPRRPALQIHLVTGQAPDQYSIIVME